MTLRLSIENMDRLPDGGPVRIQVRGRGLDIGRDQHLDWTLPDSSRHVSGKHCEIRFRDGGYWLHDVSTNGTFINGAQFRPSAPHQLRNGDRLAIGQYIVAVEVEGQADVSAGGQAPVSAQANVDHDPWGVSGDVAAPDDRRAYMQEPSRPNFPDFLDFASNIPASPPPLGGVFDAPSRDQAAPPLAPEDDWLRGKTPPPVAEPFVPPAPRPRRRASQAETPEAEETPTVAPAPSPVAADANDPASSKELLLRIARAAGIAEAAFVNRNPQEAADDIGAVLRLVAHNLALMLSSRSETKGAMRSANRTMIKALENNPLKFTASPEEALSIMFGPATRNYLDAQTAIERSFDDLKAHQIQTFSAMQAALEALFEDLAPEKIDRSVEAERGLTGLVGSRKAKLWDVYVERWRAKAKRSDGRLTEAFMALFAENYDRMQK
jgi:type VI secretion system protein ImpI